MKLKSDFSDFWDICFHLDREEDGIVYERLTRSGPSKWEQFRLLEEAGYKTVPYGRAGDVLDSWWEDEGRWVRYVVVYDDLYAHCGEGKTLRHYGWFQWGGNVNDLENNRKKQDLFVSAFFGTLSPPSTSWRCLFVGERQYLIEYMSDDDWRSNCGNVECKVLSFDFEDGLTHSILDGGKRLNYPIYAIDFVIGKHAYAIDLNIAPSLDPIKHLIRKEEVYKQVKNFYEKV